jgi:LacI family transcriptional regulator
MTVANVPSLALDKLVKLRVLAVREAGLLVPQFVALVGFDDTPITKLVTLSLTTVTQFQEELGRPAAEILFERLAGTVPERGRNEEMPHELIARESA